MIFLEIGGKKYEGFTEINVGKSIETISGSFGFSAVCEAPVVFPFKVGQKARVLIDNTPIITGYIDSTLISYTGNTRTISITGRDKTADLIDSSLKGNIEFNTGVSLKQVIEKVLANLGITDIKVFDNAGTEKFKKTDLISGSPEDNAFGFIEKYCRLRQVLITADADGNIVLTRGGKEIMQASLISEKNNPQNNILSASISYTNSNRFYSISVLAQGNPSVAESVLGVVSLEGNATDGEIRNGRNLTIRAEHSSDNQTNKNRAIWEVNFRRAKSIEYSLAVKNWVAPTGEVWLPNKLVKVRDTISDINAFMLISSCRYILNANEGQKTEITLCSKDAFDLEAQQKQADARANALGKNLIA